jgi:peptidyl-prolyl cis-trans isomerase B (cyclophilin B)
LTESGFYDGVIFHRIIPGFMIQGGDPNTINGDPSTWGIGGPDQKIDAEFNSIKHNRGIVSMARSSDPNSAGSQFFIVHKDSNFLDEQYTVFGRIVTEESFQTLDKIAEVETGTNDKPIVPEKVKITKAIVVNRSEISDILILSEPERTESEIIQPTGNQKFQSAEYGIEFSVPEGWLLQEPDGEQEGAPTIVAVGPKTRTINPQIYLIIQQNEASFDNLVLQKIEALNKEHNLEIISQGELIINGNLAFETSTQNYYSIQGKDVNVSFKEILIFTKEKVYTFGYGNETLDFESQLPRFEETIDSFKILSQEIPEEATENGGGCLIATATYGSEMALEVQQLRELRDNTLLQTESGTIFMNYFNDVYYSFSPYIADMQRENPVFKEMVKLAITPMINSLSILNYVDMDSESSVLGYGISLILLNLGMYLGVPAVVIIGIKKRN